MPPTQDDVVFAVYDAGGTAQLVDGQAVAAACHSAIEEIDVPLAEAVDTGLLERGTNVDGHLSFRLTPAGLALVEARA